MTKVKTVKSISSFFILWQWIIFGWDITNSIFELENSRSRSWQRSNPMVTFEAWSSIDGWPQLWMTSKNSKARLLYYIKLCASFQSHRWNQTGVTVRKRSIRVKIDHFLSRVTLKFDGWPKKTIGHLFHPTSSYVHHFVAIGEFKLE